MGAQPGAGAEPRGAERSGWKGMAVRGGNRSQGAFLLLLPCPVPPLTGAFIWLAGVWSVWRPRGPRGKALLCFLGMEVLDPPHWRDE